MLTFDQMLALPKSAILVARFIDERGRQPVAVIAQACNLSVSRVYDALGSLRKIGIIHDHDHVNHVINEPSELSENYPPNSRKDKSPASSPRRKPRDSDPLIGKLLELGMWEGAAVAVIEQRADREHLEMQIAWHEHRVASGYPFRDHPAKLLTFLLRNPDRDGCPAGYYEAKHRQANPAQPASPSVPTISPGEPASAPVRPATVAEATPAPLTREGALTAIRMGLKSKLPFMRENAARLALEWDIDTSRLGDCDHRATG